jgi:hypothetical protein
VGVGVFVCVGWWLAGYVCVCVGDRDSYRERSPPFSTLCHQLPYSFLP